MSRSILPGSNTEREIMFNVPYGVSK